MLHYLCCFSFYFQYLGYCGKGVNFVLFFSRLGACSRFSLKYIFFVCWCICRSFTVASVNFPGQQHTWRVNPLLQKGSEVAMDSLLNTLAWSAAVINLTASERFTGDVFSVRKSIRSLRMGFHRFLGSLHFEISSRSLLIVFWISYWISCRFDIRYAKFAATRLRITPARRAKPLFSGRIVMRGT